jgi:orotidine-5'-phosphate decarboxylase
MSGQAPIDSRIIVALDVPSLDDARALGRAVAHAVGMFKVGLELFVQAGPASLRVGVECGLPTFLDLKLHDIPETVERAVGRASAIGARFLTVHAAGGTAMLRSAVERARKEGAGLEILAVTVLTSLDRSDLACLGVSESVETHVERLARNAWDAGVRSFVCSPHEAARLRDVLGPDATLVTPGVRASADAAKDDQKRTMTAAGAVAAGADWVVIGRPIRDAPDPAAAAQALSKEVSEARAARGGG